MWEGLLRITVKVGVTLNKECLEGWLLKVASTTYWSVSHPTVAVCRRKQFKKIKSNKYNLGKRLGFTVSDASLYC